MPHVRSQCSLLFVRGVNLQDLLGPRVDYMEIDGMDQLGEEESAGEFLVCPVEECWSLTVMKDQGTFLKLVEVDVPQRI